MINDSLQPGQPKQIILAASSPGQVPMCKMEQLCKKHTVACYMLPSNGRSSLCDLIVGLSFLSTDPVPFS